MRKTLACLLIPTFITFYNTNKANALSTEVENKVINNINNDTNEDDFSLMTRYLNYELEYQRDTFQAKIHRDIKSRELIKQKVNERIDRIEERHRLEEKKRKEEEEKLNHRRNFIVTYYGATYNECGNNHFITASGVPVEEGHIAVPRSIPFGSKIILEGKEYIATDTGNPKYICELSDGTLRVDVFIERQQGESDYQYEKRVNNMGAKKIVGELYLK